MGDTRHLRQKSIHGSAVPTWLTGSNGSIAPLTSDERAENHLPSKGTQHLFKRLSVESNHCFSFTQICVDVNNRYDDECEVWLWRGCVTRVRLLYDDRDAARLWEPSFLAPRRCSHRNTILQFHSNFGPSAFQLVITIQGLRPPKNPVIKSEGATPPT